MIRRIVGAFVCILALAVVMCSKDKAQNGSGVKSVTIEVRLNGPVYQGTAYTVPPLKVLPKTDFAIWVEDANRKYIKTLKITTTVISVGDYAHCEHLPTWMTASGVTYAQLQQETGGQNGASPAYDGLTSASPYFLSDSVQTLSCAWNLTDKNGNKVVPGLYHVVIEAANITKNDPVIYTIDAEHTSAGIDLSAALAGTAPATAHILEMTVQLNSTDTPALGKHGAIMGPN